jgi:RNA-directed DNA polymerase
VSAQRARTTLEKVRELQRALYRAAKASPTRRFHALYDKMFREDVLAKAWREVKANAGSAGVDGQTIEQIEQQGVEGLLAELATELREGRYRPASSATGVHTQVGRKPTRFRHPRGPRSRGPRCREGGA